MEVKRVVRVSCSHLLPCSYPLRLVSSSVMVDIVLSPSILDAFTGSIPIDYSEMIKMECSLIPHLGLPPYFFFFLDPPHCLSDVPSLF